MAAKAAGAAVLFDAGPRITGLRKDSPPGAAAALRRLLSVSDVLLFTAEEASLLTGLSKRGEERGAAHMGWCVCVWGGLGGILAEHPYMQPHGSLSLRPHMTLPSPSLTLQAEPDDAALALLGGGGTDGEVDWVVIKVRRSDMTI